MRIKFQSVLIDNPMMTNEQRKETYKCQWSKLSFSFSYISSKAMKYVDLKKTTASFSSEVLFRLLFPSEDVIINTQIKKRRSTFSFRSNATDTFPPFLDSIRNSSLLQNTKQTVQCSSLSLSCRLTRIYTRSDRADNMLENCHESNYSLRSTDACFTIRRRKFRGY